MGKAMRVAAGALGAGALLLSAAGTASAKGGGGEGLLFDQDIRCMPSFSLLLPPTDGGCITNVFIDNRKRIDKAVQSAGTYISGGGAAVGRGGRR
ncbi:membrane protein [Streptomyces noursei ATCC 11455]|nr:membrane protein [Streptomyces noursei ATCC 11455]